MMPKPKKSNVKEYYNSNNESTHFERILYETKPNLWLYSDNFILKIVVLFLLVFMFMPVLTLVASLSSSLSYSLQMNIPNMTFIAELIMIFLILIVLIKIALDVLDWNYTTYTLTDKHLIIKRGFLRKEKITMSYSKMQDIDISQSILERILNVGDMVIFGGHDNVDTILDDIPNPKKVEEIIVNKIAEYDNIEKTHRRNINQDVYQDYYPSQENYDNTIEEHYFDNAEYDSNYVGYRDRWQKNRNNYSNNPNVDLDADEIIKRHQKLFKQHKK